MLYTWLIFVQLRIHVLTVVNFKQYSESVAPLLLRSPYSTLPLRLQLVHLQYSGGIELNYSPHSSTMLLTIVPAPLMILLLLDTTALMLVRGYHHHQQTTISRRIPLSSRHFPRCDTKYLSGATTPALRISYDDRESDKEKVLRSNCCCP